MLGIHKLKLNKGFTLIEVIMVVAIIALLVLLAIWTLRNNINKANDAKRKSDLQRIATALEDYYSDEECYPPETILANCGGSELKPYLDTIPCDPVYKTPYCYLPIETSPCYKKYRLLNTLKYLSDPAIKSLGCDSGQYCGWEDECSAAIDSNSISGFNYGVTSLNTSLLNPNMPTPTATPSTPAPSSLLSPLGGGWGCTPLGDCDNYGPGNPKCTYQFPDNTCGNGLYCVNPIYRCSP